jgi:hypothetical protein
VESERLLDKGRLGERSARIVLSVARPDLCTALPADKGPFVTACLVNDKRKT